ncbi:MAG: ankyrin repeat domain-containing protein [Bryobacterales bacterium]|nr:ankyrin repeat domain-containing protein [Bryobacterales bacterium]
MRIKPRVLALGTALLACGSCGSGGGTVPFESAGSRSQRSAFLTERMANAAFEGNTKAVEDMLPRVDVDAQDEGGRTMVMLASYGGHSTTVRLLCENKANPNLKDSNRRTALMYAASGPNAGTVEILLAHGAEVNVADGEEGYTALMFAAAEGHAEIVRMLLASGAEADLRDIDGESALKFAADNNHPEVVRLLQEASAH